MFEETSPPQPVDEETPLRLLRQGGERLLQTVTRAYVDHWPERVGELEEAVALDQRAEVGRIAHGLRSSSQLVGLTGLGVLFASIERGAAAGERVGPDAATLVRRELDSAFEQVRPWIERLTGR